MHNIDASFHHSTFTMTYLLWDEETKDAVVIDPVLDFDSASGSICYESAEKLISTIQEKKLKVHYILETHAHADHLSSAPFLKQKLGAAVAIGERIKEVQDSFKNTFNSNEPSDGSQFDRLLADEEVVEAGSLSFRVLNTYGHTPACLSFLFGDCLFTGDALFMPDFGVGRCDFPRGSADELYTSVHERLYKLPDSTRVFVGHDYQPGGRELKYETSIGESKERNIHIKASTTREEFVKFRTERDATLSAPKLLLPSIQVNAWGGALPAPENNGIAYLKLPLAIKAP